jgi:hypothetical protein
LLIPSLTLNFDVAVVQYLLLLTTIGFLSRYSRAVRPPSQDSEKSEEDRRGLTARKSPIGESFPSVGDEENPH